MSQTFPTPTPAEWRALAETALKDRPLESLVHLDADGLAVRPLYAAATAVEPLFAPRAADADGRAWDLRVLVEADDAGEANAQALAALEGGAASILLAGAVVRDADALVRALDGVALELAPVALDAGFAGPAATDALAAAARAAPRARLLFHMDPVSAFAGTGASPERMEDHLAAAGQAAARHAGTYPDARFFLASGRVAHEAGGSIGQELGFAAASAVALVKAAVEAGLPVERALQGLVLGVAVDQAYFDSLAKVRALRLMWRSISRAFGTETPATVEARSSRRMLAARDPWPNLLRLTAAGFAGAVGGAEAVVLDGFTRAQGLPDAFARRQARNTQLVLMEEANLGRVDDPASGSWFLDHRTRELAEAGWEAFRAIEAEGGIVEALRGDLIQPQVARARHALEHALGAGNEHLVGVTKFVDAEPRPAPAGAARPAPAAGGGDVCAPLAPIRLAAPFEAEGAAR
ncbi:MAG: methylmalonyl-CoA mutase [Brevundimonas sp.]|uniref:methylmalonyl-CoA mutase family protein n=1 Tax=Brevundimonas sp. TaxID=1871086 RepID=UPI0018074369|nr:methylmalonyl-CoA mutase family protein [Brevundimonas sp.]MBA4803804.1 methylmalonyl-CoA mutase [Brevundimonas sp.]